MKDNDTTKVTPNKEQDQKLDSPSTASSQQDVNTDEPSKSQSVIKIKKEEKPTISKTKNDSVNINKKSSATPEQKLTSEDKSMSQPKNNIQKKDVTSPPPKKKSGGAFAVTALVLALAAVGISGYTYYDAIYTKTNADVIPSAYEEATANQAKIIDTLKRQVTALEKQTKALENRPLTQASGPSDESFNTMSKALATLSQTTEQNLDSITSFSNELQERVNTLNSTVQRLNTDLATQKTLIVNASDKAENAQSSMSSIETRLAESIINQDNAILRAKDLIGQIEKSIDTEALQIAEIRYLLKIAIYKAQFEFDVKTAITALKEARHLMKEVKSLNFIEPLTRLEERLAELESIELIDYDTEAQRILSISNLIYQAPLKNESAIQKLKNDFVEASKDKRKNQADNPWYRNVIDNIKPVFIVTNERLILPEVISEDDVFFLNQNIQLQLSAARISMLQHLPESYYSSIKSAHEWITEYYDDANPKVAEAREELRRLSELTFTNKIPDLVPILVGFEATLKVRRGNM